MVSDGRVHYYIPEGFPRRGELKITALPEEPDCGAIDRFCWHCGVVVALRLLWLCEKAFPLTPLTGTRPLVSSFAERLEEGSTSSVTEHRAQRGGPTLPTVECTVIIKEW